VPASPLHDLHTEFGGARFTDRAPSSVEVRALRDATALLAGLAPPVDGDAGVDVEIRGTWVPARIESLPFLDR